MNLLKELIQEEQKEDCTQENITDFLFLNKIDLKGQLKEH